MSTALSATCSVAIWLSAGVGYLHALARNSCSRGTHVGGHALKNAQIHRMTRWPGSLLHRLGITPTGIATQQSP